MIIALKIIRDKSKRRCKDSLFVIPFFFTFLNAFFGYLSILKALEGECITAAAYIIVAACMDMFDGRLARALGTSSCLGTELDSLCDAISFCLAPAILLYSTYEQFHGIGMYILALYLCAGLWRLAKFNTITNSTSHFIGLPTTIAAFFIAHLVLYETWLIGYVGSLFFTKYALFGLVLGVAFLMVSHITFPSQRQYALVLPQDAYKIFMSILAFAFSLYYGFPLFLMLVLSYILISLYNHIFAH